MTVREPVALVRPPTETLDGAQEAATALMQIIGRKPRKLMFNGEQYLEVDDWETIGAFFGCTADIVWSREITLSIGHASGSGDPIRGWEARAVLLDRNGRELTHAEAMCLDDEDKWSERPRYAWVYELKGGGTSEEDPGSENIVWIPNPSKPDKSMPKKSRVQVGTGAPPEFQMRSMAQTRAIAKAHSNVFRWVARLGGFAGTPSEELDEIESVDTGTGEVKPATARQAAPKQTAAAAPATQRPTGQCPETKDGARCSIQIGHTTPCAFPKAKAKAAATGAPAAATEPAPAAAATATAEVSPVTVKDITNRSGTKAGKAWSLWTVVFSDSVPSTVGEQTTTDRAGTFSETLASAAADAQASGVALRPTIQSKTNGRGYTDHSLLALNPEA